MSRTFKKPPLVELTAELRWGGSRPHGPHWGGMSQEEAKAHFDSEELFNRFAVTVAGGGFTRVERLLPPGVVANPAQAVYRYKSLDEEAKSVVFQLGSGVLTVNASPPYKSWQTFEPRVVQAIGMLEQAFQEGGNSLPTFDAVVVRYIDAFGEEMTEGRTALDFISNVLGFTIELPSSVQAVCSDGAAILPKLQFQCPIEGGILSLSLAHGLINKASAVVLDMAVVLPGPHGADADSAIGALRKARQVLHNIFVGMTEKLAPIMQPE